MESNFLHAGILAFDAVRRLGGVLAAAKDSTCASISFAPIFEAVHQLNIFQEIHLYNDSQTRFPVARPFTSANELREKVCASPQKLGVTFNLTAGAFLL